jgi:hypothetical protein
MEIIFLLLHRFASLIISANPFAAAAAAKFHLVRYCFLFLGLLLGLSACGGGFNAIQIENTPARLANQVGTPVSASAGYQFPAHVSGGGSMSLIDVQSQVGVGIPIGKKLLASVAVDYEWADFHFSGIDEFYIPRPWGQVHMFGAAVPLWYSLSDKWTVMFTPFGQLSGEPGCNWNSAMAYGAVFAAAYNFGKDRMIGFGVGGVNYLAQPSAFPFFLVNWKFNDKWRLHTPYRSAPGSPLGLTLDYQINDYLIAGFGASFASKRFRLSDRNMNANGIGEYDNLPIYLRLTARVSIVELNLFGGLSLYNRILLYNSGAHKMYETNHNVAPIVGLGFSLNL